jgi:hypothetical protein
MAMKKRNEKKHDCMERIKKSRYVYTVWSGKKAVQLTACCRRREKKSPTHLVLLDWDVVDYCGWLLRAQRVFFIFFH